MPVHESEAVVLRQYALSEADLIVVLFTRDFGKVRAVAQGAKRLKSRMGGALEPLNHVQVRFYLREGADLARVRQCETIHSYLGRRATLPRMYAFTYIAELIQELSQENYPNYLLFRLFLATLSAGEKSPPGAGLLRYFELWALKLNGLLPDYDTCSGCGRCVKEEGFFARLDTGQACCHACARDQGLPVRPAAANLLRLSAALSPEQFVSGPWDDRQGRDLEQLVQQLLLLHLEKRLRSYGSLKEMLQEK